MVHAELTEIVTDFHLGHQVIQRSSEPNRHKLARIRSHCKPAPKSLRGPVCRLGEDIAQMLFCSQDKLYVDLSAFAVAMLIELQAHARVSDIEFFDRTVRAKVGELLNQSQIE